MAWIATMAEVKTSLPHSPVLADLSKLLPAVRLEVRQGPARSTVYEVSDAGFLIGSVPGCDLRLPGIHLPPVICLIMRHAGGAKVRKLVPTHPIQVNGRPVGNNLLKNGDRVSVGAAELTVQIQSPPESQPVEANLEELSRQLEARRQQLDLETRELETDRVIWYRRREEMKQECEQRASPSKWQKQLEKTDRELAAARTDLEQREKALAQRCEEVDRQQGELTAREGRLAQQEQELTALRKELGDIRQQLYDRYRQRRDRLAGLQEAVNRAARKVQERKQQIDVGAHESTLRGQQDAVRRAELDKQASELIVLKKSVEEQDRLLTTRLQEWKRELTQQQADLQAREASLTQEREALARDQAQYQEDLVQMHRLEASLEQRQQQLQERTREVDQRFEQSQRTSRELEDQVRQLDEGHERLRREASQLTQHKTEHEAASSQLAQRTAALEGQQAMLATLRTRLERMREELHHEQQQVAERHSRLDTAEADLQTRVQEAQLQRAELESARQLSEQERHQFAQRQADLEAAVAPLNQLQQTLAAREEELDERDRLLKTTVDAQAREAETLQVKSAQVVELQQRLEADREVLREREAALVQSEQVREALQEQLRRRAEELSARQQSLAEQTRKQAVEVASLGSRRAEIEQQQRRTEEERCILSRALDARASELARLQADAAQRQARLDRLFTRLKEAGRGLGGARKSLRAERGQWEAAQRAAGEAAAQNRAEFDAARRQAVEMQEQLLELEWRAQAAAERLAEARDQLREHLGELHSYARQSQEDLEALRAQVLAEAEQVQQYRLALHRDREQHRLAVAAFRQQLIEWQGQVAEIKRSLAQGETRLERRQAKVDEQARQIDATSARLAQQAEDLQVQERVVAERHEEMERHLQDMREWYRCKLRELSEVRGPSAPANAWSSVVSPAEGKSAHRDILPLGEEIEPGDRKLGELLRTLELVDAETLDALLLEARRQHRSLRQALLAGGYLTLYQLALIETSNLDGLVLGPLRVIDRLRVTPRETVYRVFDPRRSREAVLRHLAEAEMSDAVHPDEFRQRFSQAAALEHPHLAATFEVLEIAGRPGALQEWLVGLPSNDWPALAGVPGVWYRLLCQAALGLNAVHQAGLTHGHLEPCSFLLTGEGNLKLCGLGEPHWLSLSPSTESREESAADLKDLARIATAWFGMVPRRKGAKSKLRPEVLQTILDRLTSDSPEMRYPSVAALLEDLDHASPSVPAHTEAWERLLQQVRGNASQDAVLRQSA